MPSRTRAVSRIFGQMGKTGISGRRYSTGGDLCACSAAFLARTSCSRSAFSVAFRRNPRARSSSWSRRWSRRSCSKSSFCSSFCRASFLARAISFLSSAETEDGLATGIFFGGWGWITTAPAWRFGGRAWAASFREAESGGVDGWGATGGKGGEDSLPLFRWRNALCGG